MARARPAPARDRAGDGQSAGGSLSLLAGIWIGWVIVTGDLLRGTAATIDNLVAVFADPGQMRVLLFTLLMGPLLLLLQRGGGVAGLLEWIGRSPRLQTRRGVQLLATTLGLGVFVESTITCLVVGAVARPVFDRLRIAREKLAYLCDATSAPVCMLIPINSRGAVVLSLLTTQAALGNLGGHSPLAVFLAAVPLNFYAVLSVGLAFVVAATGWNIGPMREAERRATEDGDLVAPGARPVVSHAPLAPLSDDEAAPRPPVSRHRRSWRSSTTPPVPLRFSGACWPPSVSPPSWSSVAAC